MFRYYVNGGDDWGAILNMNGAPGTSGKNRVHSFRVASKAIKAEFYYDNDGSVYTASTDVVEDLVSEDMRLCMGERSWWNGSAQHGYVGESLAFDSALSDNAMVAVRQYLASKWLEGDAVAPTAGTTAFDSLILEGANVDMDGAVVSVGVLGGSGSITNLSALVVTGGLSFDLDGNGDPEKLVVFGDVDISAATVMDMSFDLCRTVGTEGHAVIPLIETTGSVTLGGKKHFSVGGRAYTIYVVDAGDRKRIVLGPGAGFAIKIR